jgi:hypothetical protein
MTRITGFPGRGHFNRAAGPLPFGMSSTLGSQDPFLPFYVLVAIGGLAGSLFLPGTINQETR